MWEELCTGWRLPTEAEWEYAAQGGEYYVFAGSDDIDEVGWYEKNSANVTHPVKQKKPNHYGLYDMSGNVWEWCWDWYSADQYISSQETFRRGPDSGVYRVFRGGSWNSNLRNTRIANRNYYMGQSVDNFLGFRLVRSL
jgi:formylglycine-generating enzyme required for sulfatase activity